MQLNRNTHLITKILLTGILITGLIYSFHPVTEQFSLIINGESVADPLVRFAAFPMLLAILLITGILMVLVYFWRRVAYIFKCIAVYDVGGIYCRPLFLANTTDNFSNHCVDVFWSQ